MTAPVFATALEALDFGAVDVFVEYTKSDVAKTMSSRPSSTEHMSSSVRLD